MIDTDFELCWLYSLSVYLVSVKRVSFCALPKVKD